MSKTDNNKRIDEELVCADSLSHNLRQYCGCSDVQVQREKNDPPDFWVYVDNRRYAVEITSIVTEQAYLATCRAFKDAVEDFAKNHSDLKGSYVLQIKRKPQLPHRESREWHALVIEAATFIQKTVSNESIEEFPVLKGRQGCLSIRKVDTEGATVGFVLTEGKWQGDIRKDLQELMQKAVEIKRSKLEKKGIPDQCPEIILALYDAYGFGKLDDAQYALLQTIGYKWFHSVFWATSFTNRNNELYPDSPGRDGKFLYSRIPHWWKNQTSPFS
ncbi:MAG: hypothetical protein JW849_07280 [Phycisphaerae bacterium]|nr:hypothetical protein [Phycisphaerae bacterium]